jgi:uncharacterized membrane protein YeaQ/YmgE (transglycosylase-associated protein family)
MLVTIIGWIIIGFIVGAIASLLVRGRTPGGLIGVILVGIVGAVLGGFLFNALFGVTLGFLGSVIVGVIFAVLILLVLRRRTRRTIL